MDLEGAQVPEVVCTIRMQNERWGTAEEKAEKLKGSHIMKGIFISKVKNIYESFIHKGDTLVSKMYASSILSFN